MKCNIIIAKYTKIIAKHIKKHKKLNLMLEKNCQCVIICL